MSSAATVALTHFRKHPHRLNCAQTVLNACASAAGLSQPDLEDFLVEYRAYGHGGHETGQCGAYYAACELVKGDEKATADLTRLFVDNGTALSCRGIRSVNKMSCRECVRVAAEYVERHFEGQ
ncbi:hypothetical protein J8273_1686 [Carpediemonas membranifera]|uniref:Putative redox-active protein n=1 Tax=Carpediemonas membranifera TaxID=201153 RepID=A0A8J6B8W7_9EUKA|nr:putative redox-active protein [Carpediemonas membranifera]KAG9396668.1 hypothetical protein J8273_1686 [Carpediemonas membranifera]|eukprot:KAG9396664.1 putative redox-active protein [Carpediemonas membranifera]